MDAREKTVTAEQTGGVSALTRIVPLAVLLLSFVGVVLSVGLRTGAASDLAEEAPTPAPLATPRRSVAPAAASVVPPASAPPPATPAAGSIRVTRTSGTSESLASGGYRVWFNWVLDGARESDAAVVRVFAGTTQLSEQRGLLGTNYDPATGTLQISANVQCSAAGWTAELLSLRDGPPGGDLVARVPGVTCR